MKELKWFTCAEFNALTAANYLKHQQERAALLDIGNRAVRAEERRRKRLLALDFGLVGATCAALGVLAGFLI